jgi:Tfp pilus assembly protein PilO
MKKSPKPKTLFIISGVVLLAAGGVCYMQFNALGDEQNKLTQLRPELKSPTQLRNEITELTDKLKETQLVVHHLEQGVPDFAYVPTMLKDLEARTKQQGLMFLGIRELPRQKPPELKEGQKLEKKPYTEMDFEITARGKFGDVVRFVRSLDNFPKIVATRGVTLQPKSNPKGPFLLDVTFEVRTFVFPEDKKRVDAAKTTMTAPKEARHVG